MPYSPSGGGNAAKYEIRTLPEKIVSQYTNLNFLEIQELPVDIYMLLLRDGFIFEKSQTKEGLDYLEKCWALEQTSPDKKALIEKFGRGEQNGKKH